MLAYAANRPDPARRRSSPNVMLFIVAAHIAAIAALMSTKMDLPKAIKEPPIIVDMFHEPDPPSPNPVTQSDRRPPIPNEWVTHPRPQVPTEPVRQPPVDTGGTTTFDPGPIVGPSDPQPFTPSPPKALPVRMEPRLLTPASQLRPPYPESKLLNEEEAVLHLRLTIAADGRVTSVEPIGRVDRVFFEAAQRYLIGHWRYSPASVDGRAIATTTDVTLSFRLDG